MKCCSVIPARYESSRFPGKLLKTLKDKPILQHVWERVSSADSIDSVFIATDSDKIATAAKEWGADVILTSPECASGTERIASVINQLDADCVINVQGDEPFIEASLLDSLILKMKETSAAIVTPIFKITNDDDLNDPNLVKAVRAKDGRALYFSRNAVPYSRDIPAGQWSENSEYWGHIGVYAFSRAVLEKYGNLNKGVLEDVEKLEQLRFLENDINIQTVITKYGAIGIDTPEDLKKAAQLL